MRTSRLRNMKWFGRATGAQYERNSPHITPPVGKDCDWCGEHFQPEDDGVIVPLVSGTKSRDLAYHYACHLRQIIGGANHLRGRCTCCGGAESPDPRGYSLRQAAEEAVDVWEEKHRRQSGAW